VAAKQTLPIASLADVVPALLEEIQTDLYDQALARREANTRLVESYEEFRSVVEEKGGSLMAHWCGAAACEAQVKQETKATIRCIPLDGASSGDVGACMVCAAAAPRRVCFARAY